MKRTSVNKMMRTPQDTLGLALFLILGASASPLSARTLSRRIAFFKADVHLAEIYTALASLRRRDLVRPGLITTQRDAHRALLAAKRIGDRLQRGAKVSWRDVLHSATFHLSDRGRDLYTRLVPEGNRAHTELTTRLAARLLGVSRPFLVEQLEKGFMPFRKVGRSHRIRLEDLQAYKNKMHKSRKAALDEFTRDAQCLHLGY